MTGIIILLVLIAIGISIYSKFNYWQKFTCKLIMIYCSLFLFVIILLATVFTVKDVAEELYDDTLSARLRHIQSAANREMNGWMGRTLELYKDYEPEFDYLWERSCMYEAANRVKVYKKAAERFPDGRYERQHQEAEKLLHQLCDSPTYPENQPYGDYYLKHIEE